ncbi:hypothetical protein N7504_006289 [Penicillium tannophilum]|nr:hypothetical protein N7504_006289 [Penicillium tannophilum]
MTPHRIPESSPSPYNGYSLRSASVTSGSSKPFETHLPQNSSPRKRVRRWHRRGVTGCSTCRQRHVRCDEAVPACHNCIRLGFECEEAQGRMTFKVYDPKRKPGQQKPSKISLKRKKRKDSDSDALLPRTRALSTKQQCVKKTLGAVLVSPNTTLRRPQTKFHFEQLVTQANVPISINASDGRYFAHFIDQVSSLLIIYDNSMNINPYRKQFPDFARSSLSMAGAMQALGALHLANTSVGSQRISHFRKAMSKYKEVIQLLRARYARPGLQLEMTDFATGLLLCLFEMMDSQTDNWAVHLKGACEIYYLISYPHCGRTSAHEAQRDTECDHPLRSFLVSLLSYLDIAGACASPGGTVVEGNYWETLGSGWEYNLKTPSLSSPSLPDNLFLEKLRRAWSGIMEILVAISIFARDKQWMPPKQQDVVFNEILNRLVLWRASTPTSLQLLGEMELDSESLRHFPSLDMLEYVACVEIYENATFVHLHRVAGAGRPFWITNRAYLDILITHILSLIRKIPKGIGQLAILWPLFIAGQETRNEAEQQYVRQAMEELKRFGFRNVDKSLELLEGVWFKRRAFPRGWTETMGEIYSHVLLP